MDMGCHGVAAATDPFKSPHLHQLPGSTPSIRVSDVFRDDHADGCQLHTEPATRLATCSRNQTSRTESDEVNHEPAARLAAVKRRTDACATYAVGKSGTFVPLYLARGPANLGTCRGGQPLLRRHDRAGRRSKWKADPPTARWVMGGASRSGVAGSGPARPIAASGSVASRPMAARRTRSRSTGDRPGMATPPACPA